MPSVIRSLAASVLLALSALAAAGDHPPPPANAAWQAECGACHIAYPPALLAGDQWRRLMASLEHHFGADASLDAAARDGIERFLVANAAPSGDGDHAAESLRITETEWFARKHERRAARLWRRGKVAGPADCGACHKSSDGYAW